MSTPFVDRQHFELIVFQYLFKNNSIIYTNTITNNTIFEAILWARRRYCISAAPCKIIMKGRHINDFLGIIPNNFVCPLKISNINTSFAPFTTFIL